jgi:transposase
MDRVVASIPQAQTDTLFCALELSKKTLLGIQFPDREQPSVYPIKGGDSEGLLAKLGMATDRCAKISGKKPSILICYEAGYDAFWLARFLKAHGIQCLVIDSSMQVNRRSRRAKTDRIDLGKPLRALIAWCRGERHVSSVVRVPSIDEEDLRCSHRERSRLISERTAHVNRIKGLLFTQGVRGINVKARYKTLQVGKLVTGEGRRLPPRLSQEVAREIERLALVQQQIKAAEEERDKAETCQQTEKKRLQLLALKGIGLTGSAVLAREVYYRQFGNRQQVAGFLGLATSPYASGELERCQGISRAGRGPVRATIIQIAWLWIKHQPKSAISQWFVKRTEGQSNRIKRIMIVAVARRLAIALWRYVEVGLVPQGAILTR